VLAVPAPCIGAGAPKPVKPGKHMKKVCIKSVFQQTKAYEVAKLYPHRAISNKEILDHATIEWIQ
jgi:hypothetical protein